MGSRQFLIQLNALTTTIDFFVFLPYKYIKKKKKNRKIKNYIISKSILY